LRALIVGLGNPGLEYHNTRHNVGWWLLDELHKEGQFDKFRRMGNVHAADGRFQDKDVRLIKPLTYLNRSGAVLAPYRNDPDFDFKSQLLILVDDVALPVGKFRFRPSGSAGGHNGLKHIEAVLQSQEYARLRVGVGAVPPGEDMADWVLSAMPDDDMKMIYDLMPQMIEAVSKWVTTNA
jgi:PTH1 family peptidyl-tRNA hydrolase